MRKTSIMVMVVLTLVVATIFAGCGCSDSSNDTSNQNNSANQNAVSNQTSNQASSANTSKSNTDFEPTVPLEQRKTVKPESYINGKDFDLDSYASALGYTKLSDPKGCVIYAIKRADTKCFVYITQQVIFVVFDKNDGYTYQADPLAVPMSADAYVINNGAKEDQQKANERGLHYIANIMSYLATTDAIDFSHLPELESVFKLSGSPKYFPDGTPRETSMDVVETIDVINND